MNNQFFPNEPKKLSFVMRIYEEEINNRNDWIKENVKKLNESLENFPPSPSITINYAMSIINHAMLVLRLVDKEAIGARSFNNEKEKAIERAKLLHERNPTFPEPPSSLRKIRNDFEHFEARLDEWATTSANMYVDLNVSQFQGIRGGLIQNVAKQDTFRLLDGTLLNFWNNSVDLQEVVDWVDEMSNIVIKNNRERL